MKKIPTIFVRDFGHDGGRYVTDVVTPGCEWVFAGEGVPTRKFDGTCMMFDGTTWWARREVKASKEPPQHFQEIETDVVTGKTVGWEPAEQTGFAKILYEALHDSMGGDQYAPGTYELVGPKINRNPEGYAIHRLVRHGEFEMPAFPRDAALMRNVLGDPSWKYEGVVWHHPDGRMAKIKRKDFPHA